jgi:hypothetical protein
MSLKRPIFPCFSAGFIEMLSGLEVKGRAKGGATPRYSASASVSYYFNIICVSNVTPSILKILKFSAVYLMVPEANKEHKFIS